MENSGLYCIPLRLVSAVNSCPCGHYGDPLRECKCSLSDIARYRKRASGPMLDRIDIFVDDPRAWT